MENDKYNQLLTNLELWADTLATKGPDAVDEVQGEMHQYLEKAADEDFDDFMQEAAEIKKLFSDEQRASLKEKLLHVRKQLTHELGEEPSDEVIAEEMNLPGGVDTVKAVLAL